MKKGEKTKRYFPGAYVLCFLLIVMFAIALCIGLFSWWQHNTWATVIPYTVETTIVSNSLPQSSENNNEPVIVPLTVSQDIILESKDLDVLYNRIEEHIDDYLSFSLTLLSLVFAAICVVVPIFNYLFLQKDTVEQLKKYASELSAEQDMYIANLKAKEEEYEHGLERIGNLSKEIAKTERSFKEIQRTINALSARVAGQQNVIGGMNEKSFMAKPKDGDSIKAENHDTENPTKVSDFLHDELKNSVDQQPTPIFAKQLDMQENQTVETGYQDSIPSN